MKHVCYIKQIEMILKFQSPKVKKSLVVLKENAEDSGKDKKFKNIYNTLRNMQSNLKESEQYEDQLIKNYSSEKVLVDERLLKHNRNLERDCTLLKKMLSVQNRRIKKDAQQILCLSERVEMLEKKLVDREKTVITVCEKYLMLKGKRDQRHRKLWRELHILENFVNVDTNKQLEILELLLLESMNRSETLEEINKQLLEQLHHQEDGKQNLSEKEN